MIRSWSPAEFFGELIEHQGGKTGARALGQSLCSEPVPEEQGLRPSSRLSNRGVLQTGERNG